MSAAGSESGSSEALERSEQLIDEAKDAAHAALPDGSPAEELDVPAPDNVNLDRDGDGTAYQAG